MAPSDSPTVFDRGNVVDSYRGRHDLTVAEQALFHRWIRPGSQILDLGVGVGRTTEWLSERSRTYIGIDIGQAMIAAAQTEHPDADLRVGDAADLSEFKATSFDVVVFSYNGIDCLSDLDRARCLSACRRVLRPDGVLIFSCHSPRALVASVPHDKSAIGWLGRTAYGSCRRFSRLVVTKAFWRGTGWIHDPAQGGMDLHYATPGSVKHELSRHGFGLLDREAGDLPLIPFKLRVPWWYYVARPVDGLVALHR